MSSCEWKEQTKERMPESIQARVFHRCELPDTFVTEIKDKKNILIIMDEIQVAAKKGQTIYKTFKNAGLLDKQKLYENDIKILEYTATPDGTIYDLMKWNDASSKILAEVGDGYISSYDLLLMGRVKQYKDLCGYNIITYLLGLDKEKTFELSELENDSEKIKKNIIQNIIDDIMCNNEFNNNLFIEFINENNLEKYDKIININVINEIYNNIRNIFENIQEIKDDIHKYKEPLYHIIRTKNGLHQEITIQNFKKMFHQEIYDFIKYDRESEIEYINKMLILKPVKHTFIFIKEMLRCAKTLTKKYNGIKYDRYSKNPDDTTILQGLVGRDTGYDNNGISICYTHIDSIEKYEKLWESNFEKRDIKWNSKTTKYTNGVLSGKNTFNDPKDYDGFSVESDDSDETKEPVIKKFKTQEEAKEYYNEELKKITGGRGPNKIKPNENGYYEATIRSNKKIYSCYEIKCERMYGLTENNYRFYPCYEDINNKNTLQWWLVHY